MEKPQSASLEEIEDAFKRLTIHSGDASRTWSAIGVLADASRWHPETRTQLADPAILRTLVDIVDCSVNDAIETAELALRCIGNACIDNNTASQEVTKLGFSWAKRCLPSATPNQNGKQLEDQDHGVALLTAKVLYNICSDFEPAQQECFNDHLHWQLIPLCTVDEVVHSDDKALYIELLFWICSHAQPDQHALPSHILAALLTIPTLYKTSLEPEDFAMLIETCLLFLREPQARKDIAEHRLAEQIFQMLELNERILAGLPQTHDDRRLLPPLSTALIWILSDVAASAEFAEMYEKEDEWIRDVIVPTVHAVNPDGSCAGNPRLIDAACQILGNLLFSLKSESEAFSHTNNVQALASPLLLLVNASEDAELLHSAAGLLVQLVRQFQPVREVVGADARTEPAMTLLFGNKLPQLKQDGVALLKALGRDSPENQQRFTNLARTVLQSTSGNDGATDEV